MAELGTRLPRDDSCKIPVQNWWNRTSPRMRRLLDPALRVHNLATRITLRPAVVIAIRRPDRGPPVLIFDCNGVLVDSEAIAATVASQELTRAGFKVSPEIVSRFFAGRRPTDMVADVEVATKRKLPDGLLRKLWPRRRCGGCAPSCAPRRTWNTP